MEPERSPRRSITPDPIQVEGTPPVREQDGRAVRGTMIGRYLLLRTLGEGGMGVVYAAFDPELDRKIALKLIRDKLDGKDRARQARLLREAQAMAKVSHPNVVAVHDIGTHDDQVFVAMELVEGGTLTEWIVHEPHPVSEIVTAFVEAGKGLAAAHHAGLVHRDFKPENVLVGHDGRVRVTDFGLARLPMGENTQPQPVAGAAARPDEWKKKITQVGAVVGTPLYMSPEQSRGLVPDARSDQYSFCASLYWAIFGAVPVGPIDREIRDLKGPSDPTDDEGSLAADDLDGALRFPPKPRLPARLRKVLERGLAWDPEKRYRSMDALLRDLRADSRTLRRGVAAGVGAALALVAVGAAARTLRVRPEMCGGAPRAVAAVWDDAAKAEVLEALGRSGTPDAAGTGVKVVEILDRYARTWGGTHREACEATRLRGEQTELVLSARMICLDRSLRQMGSLVRLLRAADQATAGRAVDAALDLPSVGMCDAAALSAPLPLPESAEARAEIEAVRAALDEVRSLFGTGRYQAALELAAGAAARAEATGYWPVRAEALYWKGILQDRTGAPRLAEQTLRKALVAADRAQSEPDRIRAATRLVTVEGWSLARFEEAAFFAQLAESELQRFPSDELQLNLEMQRGLWLTNERRLDEAMAAYRRALALADRTLGPIHPRKAMLLSNLAGLEEELGHHDVAISLLNDALKIVGATRGPQHPSAAYVHYNLARSLLEKGDYSAAHERIQEAIRIREAALGPDHVEVAEALDVLASLLQADGLSAEALAQSERALQIKRRALGPDHLDLCYSLENAGLAQLALHAPTRAAALLERAISLRESAGLPAESMVAARFGLAQALWEVGKERRRALELAGAAREGALTGKDVEVAGKIAGWLASRS